jgi:hypothetical protein
VQAALRWLADGVEAGDERTSSPGVRTAEVTETPAARVSLPPPGEDEVAPEAADARARLADALEDVVTVVGRAGAGELASPSVAESLDRLRKESSQPIPVGLSRWLGRLKLALEAKDVGLVARLLDGAGRLADALRMDRPSRGARRRAVGWLGASSEAGVVERLSDRQLVEVAREHLPSDERGGIERRYLVDLHNGEVFREERSRSAALVSVGPCPRLVSVGLAEVEDGAAPRRIRLMQYTVTLDPGPEELGRIAASAYRRFPALVDRYRAWLSADPGQAEPFAIVAPKRWGDNGETVCFDDEGLPLPFARADDPAGVEVLGRYAATGPRWVAGRLVDVEGTLMMLPCSVAIPDGEGSRVVRLR